MSGRLSQTRADWIRTSRRERYNRMLLVAHGAVKQARMRSFIVMRWWRPLWVWGAAIFLSAGPNLIAQDTRATPTYRRFKQELDVIA